MIMTKPSRAHEQQNRLISRFTKADKVNNGHPVKSQKAKTNAETKTMEAY